MDAFDDEPNTGGGYDKAIEIEIFGNDGIPRRIVMRFRGQPVKRVSVVLEEVRAGQHGAIMRYDDAHGGFHRHAPGWPQPSREIEAWFPKVLPNERAPFATDEIRMWYPKWEAQVFKGEAAK